MKNVLLSLSYDGSEFLGWQKTKEGPSIESSLEKALFSLLGETPFLQAASRTDRGVHAKDQKVNFFTRKRLSLKDLAPQLQTFLPPSIVVFSAEEVPLSFHPSLNAKKKEYRYCISMGTYQMAFLHSFAWHCPATIDVEKMKKAAPAILGRHDFSGFSSETKKNPMCHLYRLDICQKSSTDLIIVMEADRFLYHMARTIVGTLLHIGKSKIAEDSFLDILLSLDRRKAGPTAPPHGLFLEKITYEF